MFLDECSLYITGWGTLEKKAEHYVIKVFKDAVDYYIVRQKK